MSYVYTAAVGNSCVFAIRRVSSAVGRQICALVEPRAWARLRAHWNGSGAGYWSLVPSSAVFDPHPFSCVRTFPTFHLASHGLAAVAVRRGPPRYRHRTGSLFDALQRASWRDLVVHRTCRMTAVVALYWDTYGRFSNMLADMRNGTATLRWLPSGRTRW